MQYDDSINKRKSGNLSDAKVKADAERLARFEQMKAEQERIRLK